MTRILAMSGLRAQGLLVDDRLRELPEVEQRGDPAHRLGMAEADEAAGIERLVERLGGAAAGRVVEVDQQVAAEHDVEAAELPGRERVREVDLREGDRLADVR